MLKIKSKEEGISDREVLQAFRQACWDLYISNLPDPVIIDTKNPKKKDKDKIPEELRKAVPRGFSIDPETWTIYFNSGDLPGGLSREQQREYSRSIFQHEDTHFTQVPADGVTEAILVDSALKGFKDPNITRNKDLGYAYSRLIINIMGDLIGDTLLAKERYGREDFGELTLWRQRETIREARQTQQTPSPIWTTLVASYEKLWGDDLGLRTYVSKLEDEVEKASDELVKVLGRNWRDRGTWEDKVRQFATILEPIIKKSSQQAGNQRGDSRYNGQDGEGKKGKGKKSQDKGQSGEGSGLPMPDDARTQMGNTTESPLGKPGDGEGVSTNGRSESVDERVLEEIYERNKNSPGKFAGTMGALHKLEPDDSLRLMYRARARELLMRIEEKENQRAERRPSYQTGWNIGDPLLGKGGLELVPSMMASGKPIPGLTTYKRKMDASEEQGRLKMIPDLFIVIDSSGSMSWSPWSDSPDARGDFDKAILAAEGAALYALDNGGRVAVVNFSGKGNVTEQDYTHDVNGIEKAVMVSYGGGTVVPINRVKSLIKKTQNPLLTCLMSDCEISNYKEACEAFVNSISEHDTLTVFNIGKGSGANFTNCAKERGAIVYGIDKIEDLAGMIIGEVRRKYDSNGREDAN